MTMETLKKVWVQFNIFYETLSCRKEDTEVFKSACQASTTLLFTRNWNLDHIVKKIKCGDKFNFASDYVKKNLEMDHVETFMPTKKDES